MTKVRVHVYVSGIVQGVNFRYKTKRQAEGLGVNGWVRNLPDGRVEAVFEGEEETVRALVAYCHHGPSFAMVTNVDVVWEPFRGEFGGFETR